MVSVARIVGEEVGKCSCNLNHGDDTRLLGHPRGKIQHQQLASATWTISLVQGTCQSNGSRGSGLIDFAQSERSSGLELVCKMKRAFFFRFSAQIVSLCLHFFSPSAQYFLSNILLLQTNSFNVIASVSKAIKKKNCIETRSTGGTQRVVQHLGRKCTGSGLS